MTITTNNIPRKLISGYDLTEKEKLEFDYMDEGELTTGAFFRYRGMVYSMADFMHTTHADWHGVQGESAFSAVLIRLSADGESVVIAREVA